MEHIIFKIFIFCMFIILGVLIFGLLTGCHLKQVFDPTDHVTGTQVTQQQIDTLKSKKSTVADVESMLGAPQDIKTVGSEVHYVYNYNVIRHYGENTSEATNFIFDKDKNLLRVLKGKGNPNDALLKAR